MGLKYVSGESGDLISGLTTNLGSAHSTIESLKASCQQLTDAIDGNTLSGAAYTAGKGLFQELIMPTITRVTEATDDVKSDLSKYSTANDIVSDESLLDEDNLKQQIAIKKASKKAVDAASYSIRLQSISNPIVKLADALFDAQNRLDDISDDLQDGIDKLQEKLDKLHEFSSAVSGLFSDSLNNFKIAMQGVTVLNNTTVNSDGTYSLPEGADKSWFTEIKNNKPNQKEMEEIAKSLGISVKELWDLYGSVKKEYGNNAYFAKNFIGILTLMKPGSITQGKFSTFGKHGQKTFNYLMKDWREIKKYLRKMDNPAAQKLLAKMSGSFNQFLKNVEKLKDFKGIAKYTKPLEEFAGWATDVTKKGVGKLATKLPKIKSLGKLANKLGWVAMAANVGYDGFTSYNDKNSAGYHNVGKAAVHAGVNQLKSAGPLEGALAGAAVGGPWGAAIGFGAGSVNAILGAVSPKAKDKFYDAIEKGGDWVVDKVTEVGKSAGKAAKGAWDKMTPFFGGGKHATV